MVLNMNTVVKLVLFAAVYVLAFQQGVLLLSDYHQSPSSELVLMWPTYIALFIFNLLSSQVTHKYFKEKQIVLFSAVIAIASVLYLVFAQSITDYLLIVCNLGLGILAVLCQLVLDKQQSKKTD